MNKILNINLGGFAFTIDDDAYEYLSAYLDSIRRRFSASEGRDEILSDIEMRLGELVTAELGNRSIVMLPDVEAAVHIMGKPEDFGADPIDNRRNMGGSGKQGTFRTGRRLFRDEEEKVAGGICSGLAAYFGMSDPVWMRLIFVLLTLISAGFWIPAYIILWVLIPPARTAADRLAMRGEPINVDNIAKEVEDGFERLGEKVNQFGANAKKKSGINGPNAQNGLSNVLNVIGSVFAFFVQFFAKFGILILILVAVAIFIALVVGWIGSFWGFMAAAPYLSFFSPFTDGTTYLAATSLFFLLAIPAVGLAIFLAGVLFKFKANRWLGIGLASFWALNLFAAIGLLITGAGSFRQSRTLSHQVDLSGLKSDTLRVEYISDPDLNDYDEIFHGDGIRLIDKDLLFRMTPDIRVKSGKKDIFECTSNITARGNDSEDAMANAQIALFKPVLEGNTLRVPSSILIPRGKKFRAQNAKLTIIVPPGKFIVFGEEICHNTWDSDYADNETDYRIGSYPNKVFRMTEEGLVCADCPNFGSPDYQSDRSYENFILEGNFKTEIRRGDDFKLDIKDGAGSIDVIRTGNKLTLAAKSGAPPAIIMIETPVFTDLYANNTGEVIIRGFDEGRSTITARGNSQIKGYFDSGSLSVNLSGPCRLELIGKGSNLEADLTDAAVLEAGAWRCDQLEINAANGSKARIYVKDNARIKRDASSDVKVDGNGTIQME